MDEVIALQDVGALQVRYQSLGLAARAQAVLKDAAPALAMAERILAVTAEQPLLKQAFDTLRKNSLLTGKMRASEALNLLLDGGDDFIRGTRHKLAAWKKTMERIAGGEGIVEDKTIPRDAPLAVAIIGSMGISNFLSIVQLALAELAKLDAPNAADYIAHVAGIRRCSTVLSDYENAAAFQLAIR